MKKKTNSKSNKEYKKILSPMSKRQKNTFSHNNFKDLEINKIPLSHKKSQDELILNKNNNVSNNFHRRIKSNSGNYIDSMTNLEQNFGINNTFIIGKNPNKEQVTKNEINPKISVGRNYKKQQQREIYNNILPSSCSLKDFRNFIIMEKKCENDIKKYYNNDLNLYNNKIIYSNDILTNIEETRNTTSINIINNNNLLYSKHFIEMEKGKENGNKENKKHIKISRKKNNSNLYSPIGKKQKIDYTNTNNDLIKEKYQKYNLHRYIYNNNNLKGKNNKNNITKINYNYNSNYLNTTKKSFRNSEKKFSNINKNYKNLSIICPISDTRYEEPLTFYNSKKRMNFSQREEKNVIKKNFPSSTTNKNNEIRFTFTKYKKRNNKSQENIFYKSKIKESEEINEFDSVEEIHFMFVEITQKKKNFFQKNNDKNNKKI